MAHWPKSAAVRVLSPAPPPTTAIAPPQTSARGVSPFFSTGRDSGTSLEARSGSGESFVTDARPTGASS
ncbi:Uncharacterised protein [Mycobacterium tuberculosis]|nr:Uncharacterised protein [Mycobacterium tuberculosis]